MDNIEDIYKSDVYYPFLMYCQRQNYQTMQDLVRCKFDTLSKAGLSPTLIIRIKALFTAYCRKHPDLLMHRPAPAKPRASAASVPPPGLADRLQAYFKEHADTLIRCADAAKALGAKRNDVTKLLDAAAWCKAVDTGTYFYAPVQEDPPADD